MTAANYTMDNHKGIKALGEPPIILIHALRTYRLLSTLNRD